MTNNSLPDPRFPNPAGERYKSPEERAAEDRAIVIDARLAKTATNEAITRIYEDKTQREKPVLQRET